MHENSITFRHNHQIVSRLIEGMPIPGYSFINEVAKKALDKQADSKKTDKEKAAEARAQPAEDTTKTPLSHLVPEKCVHIGTGLTENRKQNLISFLHEYQDVFAWSAKDLQGVSRDLA